MQGYIKYLMIPVFSPSGIYSNERKGNKNIDFTECWISKNDIPEIDYPENKVLNFLIIFITIITLKMSSIMMKN